MSTTPYDDIRPYTDAEVPAAVARLAQGELFALIEAHLFAPEQHPALRQQLLQARTVADFQRGIVRTLFDAVAQRTMQELTHSGLDLIDTSRPHLYLANHRDIVLDSVLLMYHLLNVGLDTAEITFGSNLMQTPDIIDFGRLNKMFRFMRSSSSTSRELLAMSRQNSDYMRHAIVEKGHSVWLAQRNGRTKNGDDRTDVGVLKMLAMSSPQPSMAQTLAPLSIVPVCVSYEFEPCDFLKTRELYLSRRQRYEKSPGEDLNSMVQGIMRPKGRVHLAVCQPIGDALLAQCSQLRPNEGYRMLAHTIDQRMHAAYRLWPNNYIAHDWLHNAHTHAQGYTPQQREHFEAYIRQGIEQLEGDAQELLQIALGIYASPVDNAPDGSE